MRTMSEHCERNGCELPPGHLGWHSAGQGFAYFNDHGDENERDRRDEEQDLLDACAGLALPWFNAHLMTRALRAGATVDAEIAEAIVRLLDDRE